MTPEEEAQHDAEHMTRTRDEQEPQRPRRLCLACGLGHSLHRCGSDRP